MKKPKYGLYVATESAILLHKIIGPQRKRKEVIKHWVKLSNYAERSIKGKEHK